MSHLQSQQRFASKDQQNPSKFPVFFFIVDMFRIKLKRQTLAHLTSF